MTTPAQAAHRASFYAALRSGRFRKAKYRLLRKDESCCVMGASSIVAMEDGAPITLVYGNMFREANHPRLFSALAPHCVEEWYGFPSRNPRVGKYGTAAMMNDDTNLDFPEMAKLFEETYPAVADEF